MTTYISASEPKSFSLRQSLLQHLFLGVPLAIWALSLLLIAAAAHFDAPIVFFDSQEFLLPF